MMHSTLDILLISDPSSGTDKTGEWESQCDERNAPKIKFPLKLKDERVNSLDLEFNDPVVEEPKLKKKEKNKNEVKVVTLTSKKNKDKNKLF
jgi:hypothetical protein